MASTDESQAAGQVALALLTASYHGNGEEAVEMILSDCAAPLDTLAAMTGMAVGLLRLVEDLRPAAAQMWLSKVGSRLADLAP